MSKTLKNPTQGGSYKREKDGSLTKKSSTKPRPSRAEREQDAKRAERQTAKTEADNSGSKKSDSKK